MPDVLFVCSGNTCRSPMAMCLFNDRCAHLGLAWRAESAGLSALDGTPASDGAFFVMKERGLDLSRHVAQPVTLTLLKNTRLVVTMGQAYVPRILERWPAARVLALEPSVRDPFGASLEAYRATATELEKHLPRVLEQLRALP